jgi:hypothetical protein
VSATSTDLSFTYSRSSLSLLYITTSYNYVFPGLTGMLTLYTVKYVPLINRYLPSFYSSMTVVILRLLSLANNTIPTLLEHPLSNIGIFASQEEARVLLIETTIVLRLHAIYTPPFWSADDSSPKRCALQLQNVRATGSSVASNTSEIDRRSTIQPRHRLLCAGD